MYHLVPQKYSNAICLKSICFCFYLQMCRRPWNDFVDKNSTFDICKIGHPDVVPQISHYSFCECEHGYAHITSFQKSIFSFPLKKKLQNICMFWCIIRHNSFGRTKKRTKVNQEMYVLWWTFMLHNRIRTTHFQSTFNL